MQIKMTFELPAKITKKKKWYVANCPALNVASQGDTPEEAKAHLEEAVLVFLESCLERGVLEEVLRDCGFGLSLAGEVVDSVVSAPAEEKINVLLYLLAKHASAGQCHHA